MLVWLSPKLLFRRLFAGANAKGEDKSLAADPGFQISMTEILRSSFHKDRRQGYLRDIKAYVQPWAVTPPGITAKAYIWHGAENNWSPKTMAEYLHSALQGSQIEITEGLSHYSCLYEAAPKRCQQLGKT